MNDEEELKFFQGKRFAFCQGLWFAELCQEKGFAELGPETASQSCARGERLLEICQGTKFAEFCQGQTLGGELPRGTG